MTMKEVIAEFKGSGKKWKLVLATNRNRTWFEIEKYANRNSEEPQDLVQTSAGFVTRKDVRKQIPIEWYIEDFFGAMERAMRNTPEVFLEALDRRDFRLFADPAHFFFKKSLWDVGLLDNLVDGGEQWPVALIQILFHGKGPEEIEKEALRDILNPKILKEARKKLMTVLMVYEEGFVRVDCDRVIGSIDKFVKNFRKYSILKWRSALAPTQSRVRFMDIPFYIPRTEE